MHVKDTLGYGLCSVQHAWALINGVVQEQFKQLLLYSPLVLQPGALGNTVAGFCVWLDSHCCDTEQHAAPPPWESSLP